MLASKQSLEDCNMAAAAAISVLANSYDKQILMKLLNDIYSCGF